MKMYKTSSWKAGIEETEITRKTDKSVWFMAGYFGNTIERRALVKSDGENYFDTWDEAHEHLIGEATKKLYSAKRSMEYAEKSLAECKILRQAETA